MNRFIPPFILLAFIFCTSCDLLDSSGPGKRAKQDKMIVFSGATQMLYRVNLRVTNRIEKIPINLPAGVIMGDMNLSTDGNNIFFYVAAPFQSGSADIPIGFIVYDISKNKLSDPFFLELNFSFARIAAAQNDSEPGLVYAHLRDSGTFAIDIYKQEIVDTLSVEHAFTVQKEIHHSPDKRWSIIHRKQVGTGGYHELQFYEHGSNLQHRLFTLNEAGRDGILIGGFVIPPGRGQLILSYRLKDFDNGPPESYLGVYDLNTKEFQPTLLTFPGNTRPYSVTYNEIENEVYLIDDHAFHIIDAQTFKLKDSILLPENVFGNPEIIIRPDGDYAFANFSGSDRLLVFNLRRNRIEKSIPIDRPSQMIIP